MSFRSRGSRGPLQAAEIGMLWKFPFRKFAACGLEHASVSGNSGLNAQLLSLSSPADGEVRPVHQLLQAQVGRVPPFEDGTHDFRREEGQRQMRLHIDRVSCSRTASSDKSLTCRMRMSSNHE